MHGQRRAIIIGVNGSRLAGSLPRLKYAETDAKDLYDALTDPVTGTFDPVDVTLLVGPGAGTAEVKRALRDCALSSGADDFMLIAFAGHALVPAFERASEAYLVTHDLDLATLRLEPDAGLRTNFLRRDVLEESAGSTLLILDCCQAGRLVEGTGEAPDSRPLRTALYDAVLQGATRHSALLSCPRDMSARETDAVRHGVFTHHLLRGLGGDAAGANGEVNLDSLAGFLGGIGVDPPVGRFVQAWGEAVPLTRPAMSPAAAVGDLSVMPGLVTLLPLRHPLEGAEDLLLPLLAALAPKGEGLLSLDQAFRLTRVSAATGSDSVGLLEMGSGSYKEVAWDRYTANRAVTALLVEIAARDSGGRRGALGHIATSDNGTVVLSVRLSKHRAGSANALVLVNPAPDVLQLGEPLASILETYMAPTQPFGAGPIDTEIGLLTSLRAEFGRLPVGVYERAYELYQQRLRSMAMVFEPVVSLSPSPEMLGVQSWEALARGDAKSHSAPVALLDAAETWGSRFFIERDGVLADQAIQTYAQAHRDSSYDTPKPIGINVAIRSLLSPVYLETLREAISRTHLPRSSVTLEISEKDPITAPPGEIWLDPIKNFRTYLSAVAGRMHINFAVDDFGVGHASLDRISMLTLAHIKIDPTVMQHELALDELALVVKVAQDAIRKGVHASRPIVMEGVEVDSAIPLADIYRTGIQHVQGYIVGDRATSELKPLDQKVRERIAAQLTGART